MSRSGPSRAHAALAVREVYNQRESGFAAERDRAAARSARISALRVFTFTLFLAAGVWTEARPGTLPLTIAMLALVAFVTLVVMQGRVRQRERWADALATVNHEGKRRLDRDWNALPVRAAPDVDNRDAYAADLDLYGRASLRQLLGATVTPAGETTLAHWLFAASDAETGRARQAAVRALASHNDVRDELAAHARLSSPPSDAAIERFLGWTDALDHAGSTRTRVLAWIVPALTWASGTAAALDLVPWSLPLAFVLFAAVLTFGRSGRAARVEMTAAFGREEIFRVYPELLALAESVPPDSPRLRALHDALAAGGIPATAQMHRLARLAHLAGLRASGQLYLPVQLLTLWDFHVLARLHAWRRTNRVHVRQWLAALGEFEALAALATLAHDHPDWGWPEIVDDASPAALDAQQLGHPLIAESERVHNDVRVGPPGTFLLVTGSNMSGKSTLLRAIGVNAVLALAGGPVCARALRMPIVDLRTAIHVQDSLAEGVSYFMAQLRRMKDVVHAADRARDAQQTVLYLLDEILQGTNTAERRIAAARVIRHLVDAGAIGAVTTHDLELAEAPELVGRFQAVHLRETVHSGTDGAGLTFDYILRPGIATSTNALRLMELVGLGD